MKILIISGGQFEEETIKEYLNQHQFDYTLTVDGGTAYAKKLGITPNLILGDFDTLDQDILEEYQKQGVVIQSFPPEKDYTDTHLALAIALERNPSSITIFAGTGTRMDHTLANIGLLTLAVEKGVSAEIIDAHNRIRMIRDRLVLKKEEVRGKYVSLIPYTEKVEGVNLTGFRYPLYNAVLTTGVSQGISNEIVEETGSISMKQGLLLVIESQD